MSTSHKLSPSEVKQRLIRVGRARTTHRWLIGIVIALVVFGLLGFFAAPPLIRHVAEQQLGAALDRPVSIGRVALNPYTLNLEVDQLAIAERGNTGPFVSLDKLVVRTSWGSIFRFAPVVDELTLQAPHFHLVRTAAQRFNFSDIVDKFSAPSPKPPSKGLPRFSISNIKLVDGRVDFDDQVLSAKHVIDDWQIGIPFVATLKSKTDIFVEPLLKMRIDGSPLEVSGKTKPFKDSRESDIALRFDKLDIPKLLSYSPAALPVVVTQGALSSNLDLRFIMAEDKPSLIVAGTVDVAGLAATDHTGAPLTQVDAIHVATSSLEPLQRQFHFDEIRLTKPVVQLVRDAQGKLNLLTLPPAPTAANANAANADSQAAAAASAPAVAAAPASAANPASAPDQAQAQSSSSASAEAPAPLDLAIQKFAIDHADINIVDHLPSAAQPIHIDVNDLNVTLDRFSTLSNDPAHYTLASSDTGGGVFNADGDLWLKQSRTSVKLDIHSVPLAPRQPYLAQFVAGVVTKGTLDVNGPLDADWSKTPFAMHIGNLAIGLDGVELVYEQTKQPVLSLGHALAQIDHVDLGEREAVVKSIELDHLALKGQRLRDGSIDLAKLQRGGAAGPDLSHAPTVRAAAKAVKGEPSSADWHYEIQSVSLKQSSVDFADRTTPQPVSVSIDPLDVTVEGLSDDLSKPIKVRTAGTLNKSGTFDADGRVTPKPLGVALRLNGKKLDIASVEPYFAQYLNVTLASARLSASGDVAVSGSGSEMKAGYKGDVSMTDVRMLDKVTAEPFAGWTTLSLSKLVVNRDANNTDVSAGVVTFAGFYGSVVLDKQGKLNLKDIAAKPGAPPESMAGEANAAAAETAAHPLASNKAKPAPEPASAPVAQAAPASTAQAANAASAPPATLAKSGMDLRFGQLVLRNGRAVYTDNFVQPNYTAKLIDINGTIGAFGTKSTTPAPVDIKANLSANGPVTIKGSINPLTKIPTLDLTAAAHDVELTNLTPYSTKYAGYPITKGKLNVDLHYVLDNDHLSADNHIFIDQLTFGDHVDNDTATKLPVKLALALLTNSRGEIDVDIPVSGSLSNPQFSIGGLIWQAVLNLLQKAVTAPFTLLANAFGGHSEELGYIEFEPGSAKLSDAQQKKLDTVAKMLTEKTSIKLDVIGRVDPKVDEPALREAAVDRAVKEEKIKDTVGKGESVDTDSITIAPDEYDKYLKRAYKDTDFKKDTNLVGMTKTLPDDQMKQLMLDHTTVGDEQLRELAQDRAAAVLHYFEGKTDLQRVFVVAPKLNADGIQDKGPATRVDFNLK
ncbi:DUF748 domain-containing protein [Pararobbsia silviterrae]|uniref:DUF748 domain-containing protein n=1 Tax=Pararobbsia silviterrae TaxID=1792498 RepID=A0A494X8K0_9BURK|nr:DUF748 domain-containing protein [Pararobbsia silviterrae]RKP46592.1 DUF748 domain-containing protein [Pararobbsia silviterrae]